MKKNKIVIINLLLAIACITTTNAQEAKTTMELLLQNNWRTEFHLNGGVDIISKWTFTKNEFTEKAEFQEGDAENIFKYYLSNKPDTTFNYDKVGKVLNGHYIIFINKLSDVTIYEIAKISETELEIYVLSRKSRQREGQEKVKYIAIPKE